MALGRSPDESTISVMKACRVGMSNALMQPRQSNAHQLVDGDQLGDGQVAQKKCLDHRQRLRGDDDPPSVPAIAVHAGEQAQEQHRDLPGEIRDAQQKGRVASLSLESR